MKPPSAGPTRPDRPIPDRDGPTALYLQVAADLATRIGRREWTDRLPSEAALLRRYAVSRVTIRLALAHLARRGLVTREQGRGTFVTRPRNRVTFEPARGLIDILNEQGVAPDMELLRFEPVRAPDPVAAALGLGRGSAQALLLQRRYMIAGQPAVLAEVFYPPSVGSAFSRAEAARHSSVVLLTRFAGLSLGRTDITMQVQPASAAHADRLSIEPGSALMVVRRVTRTEAGEPCEFSTLYARAGVAEFAVTTTETGAATGFRSLLAPLAVPCG